MREKSLMFWALALEVAICDLKRLSCAPHLEITNCDHKIDLAGGAPR